MRTIIQFPNKILTTPAKPVAESEIQSEKIQNLIDEMLEVVNANITKNAGLAAPQIGELLSICICQRFDLPAEADGTHPLEVMINPRITNRSRKQQTMWDGCLSIQQGELFAKTTRSSEVTVEYLDREANPQTITAEDYFAHVVQHEVDHLHGKLFLSYVKDLDDLHRADEFADSKEAA